ncbi:MAG: hypothetical protein RIC38_08350 [Chromatocurvus sp.]
MTESRLRSPRGRVQPRDLWLFLLAASATVAYCLAAGYVSLIWSTLTASPEYAPMLTRLTVMPWGKNPEVYLWHWNVLAITSLAINIACSLRLRSQNIEIASPVLAHLAWLLFATFMHLSGFAASMVGVIYVLE